MVIEESKKMETNHRSTIFSKLGAFYVFQEKIFVEILCLNTKLNIFLISALRQKKVSYSISTQEKKLTLFPRTITTCNFGDAFVLSGKDTNNIDVLFKEDNNSLKENLSKYNFGCYYN